MGFLEELIKKPFGAQAAQQLCRIPGIFEPGRLYKREQISTKLRSSFVERGGNEHTSKHDVAAVLKKWLRQESSPFEKVHDEHGEKPRGWYQFIGYGNQQAAFERLRYTAGIDSTEDSPKPERDYGDGPYEVYAWCLPRYRKAYGDRCPIQIGRAGPDGFRRRLRDFWENLPERPSYLLRIGCLDEAEARRRETLLHAWFQNRRQRIEDLPGHEWFLISPSEIEEAIRAIIEPTVGMSTPGIESEIADIFEDVPAKDWESLPKDLTDRLDHYLYGDES